jgi:TRAP-type C4-dicarboxylate transport system substrate-binding protein
LRVHVADQFGDEAPDFADRQALVAAIREQRDEHLREVVECPRLRQKSCRDPPGGFTPEAVLLRQPGGGEQIEAMRIAQHRAQRPRELRLPFGVAVDEVQQEADARDRHAQRAVPRPRPAAFVRDSIFGIGIRRIECLGRLVHADPAHQFGQPRHPLRQRRRRIRFGEQVVERQAFALSANEPDDAGDEAGRCVTHRRPQEQPRCAVRHGARARACKRRPGTHPGTRPRHGPPGLRAERTLGAVRSSHRGLGRRRPIIIGGQVRAPGGGCRACVIYGKRLRFGASRAPSAFTRIVHFRRPWMKRLTAFAAAFAIGVALPAVGETKWDMPTAYPANNFHTENIQQFAGDVDRASGGRLKITVHPNASLFKAPEIKRAVQGGQAQAGEILLVNFENEDPLYGLDGVPFLATSYAESLKLYKASKKALEDKVAKQGMKLVYTVPWPPQGIYTSRTLNGIADMKGLKWRAYSPATSKIAELVGAQPVTVQAAEVSQALATGVIDSYMSSGATGYDSKTYEHIRNFYDTQAWLPKNAIIVNQKAFDALDKATQAALLKAAADAEARGWKLSEEKNMWYVDQLKAKGMTIVKPPDQLMADLRKVGNYMLAEWLRKTGADGRKVIDAYRAM